MLTKDKIKRLNELANKAKSNSLTVEEKEEQRLLREEYIKNFREHFRNRLENITIVDNTNSESKDVQ